MKYGMIKTLLLISLAVAMKDVVLPSDSAGSLGPILNLEELDEDGGQRQLSDPMIVDAMSEIRITIQRDALNALAGEYAGTGLPASIEKRLEVLREILVQRRESLQHLQRALSLWSKIVGGADDQPLDSLAQEVEAAARPVESLLPLIQQSSLASELETRLQPPGGHEEQYAAVYDVGAMLVEQMQRDLEALARDQGVSVRMGAWIVTADGSRPIHLPGFDDYLEGPEFVIPRWELALNTSEQKQVRVTIEAAQELGKTSDSVLEYLALQGREELASLLASSKTVAKAKVLIDQVKTIEEGLAADQQAVWTSVDSLREDAQRFSRDLMEFEAEFRWGWAGSGQLPAELLTRTNRDLATIVAKAGNFTRALEAHSLVIQARARKTNGSLRSSLTALQKSVVECAEAARADSASLGSGVRTVLGYLESGRRIDSAALRFGQEVHKLTLDSVPEEAIFPLRTTGPRASGDAVEIKIAVIRADGTVVSTERVLESHRLRLFRVLPHIERTVGMIFADPRGNSPVKHLQPAAGYSLLLKGLVDGKWRRGSILYNTLVDPGIGLHLAALDFNKDDTPELGVGLVLSVFRDVLQTGAGYDLSAAKKYGFLGIRLPMPTR